MRTVLIVSPLDSGRFPGAVQLDADCGHRAWVSPSGVALRVSGGVVLHCEDCVDPSTLTDVRAAPGVREELTALLGAAGAEQLMADVQADPAGMLRTLQASNRRRRDARRRG